MFIALERFSQSGVCDIFGLNFQTEAKGKQL
jgi:hypothetical protein